MEKHKKQLGKVYWYSALQAFFYIFEQMPKMLTYNKDYALTVSIFYHKRRLRLLTWKVISKIVYCFVDLSFTYLYLTMNTTAVTGEALLRDYVTQDCSIAPSGDIKI